VGSLPPCKRGEIEKAIMTVSDGSRIHGWWNQFHRVIEENGHGDTHGFSTMERSSKKNFDLRSKLKCGGVRGGVKGRDERKERALDPAPHADAVVRLDRRQRRHTQDDSTFIYQAATPCLYVDTA